MDSGNSEKIKAAKQLLDDFSERTGLTGESGDESRRYLWTDAFAVQGFFGLAHILKEPEYKERALQLIRLVHYHLGQFHPADEREGWISGLSGEEARNHPTAGGLRIGKKLPERKEIDQFDRQLEWDRDGQYFHYLTRWITALLQAARETGDRKYAEYAAELMEAAGKFIVQIGGAFTMHWKMSTDLSRPLVESMGAHDPLEGLICTKGVQHALEPEELEPLAQRFESLCRGMDWKTTDPLGIGGLLLNTIRCAELAASGEDLPALINPEKLLNDALISLRGFTRTYRSGETASQRLAFRECGLTLGIRVLAGVQENAKLSNPQIGELEQFEFLAEEMENFWQQQENQEASTWTDHLDINAVSLACSMVAKRGPAAFSGSRD